jgi:hypothetical protein
MDREAGKACVTEVLEKASRLERATGIEPA